MTGTPTTASQRLRAVQARADLDRARARLVEAHAQDQFDTALWWVAVLGQWTVSVRPRPDRRPPLPIPIQRQLDRETARRALVSPTAAMRPPRRRP